MQKDINTAWINFSDITQKIIDYHNQIKLQTEFYKKVQKIKRLKDKRILTENTNIEKILIRQNSLFFSGQQKHITQISIPYLQTDEAFYHILKISKEVKNRNSITKQKIADEIADNQIEKKEKNILAISPAKIKQLFTAGSGELFDFIENYEFPTDLSLEQKTTLFCKIASRYSDELIHTKEYKTFNDIEYAVIKSKN